MENRREVVIVAATRSAIGRFQGSLASLPAHHLAAELIRHIVNQTNIDVNTIDEVILGQALTTGCGQNPARQAAILAGLPYSVPAMTINKVCGSGLKAVQLAAQAIGNGSDDFILAGGQENMSLAPYFLPNARTGLGLGHVQMEDSLIRDGLWDAFNDYHMGITAENLSQRYAIGRQEQDAYAITSQDKALEAIAAGRFRDEITPISVPQPKGEPLLFDTDEQPREGSSHEKLARLKPAFKLQGTVTAGNSSSLNDGAAVLLIASAEKAQKLGLPILAKVKSYAIAAVDPAVMGIAPVVATRLALARAGWHIDDLDLIESNEAFAAQALAVNQALGWDTGKINVNGGAIALGHPLGASGARILVTLIHELRRRGLKKGLATLCVGGGQGLALTLECP